MNRARLPSDRPCNPLSYPIFIHIQYKWVHTFYKSTVNRDQEFNLNQCLARVYLISDILYNSTAVPKASRFRALFDAHLSPMFEKLHSIHVGIESRFVAEQFRTRIRTVLQAWATWSLFTSDTLIKLNNIFMWVVIYNGSRHNIFALVGCKRTK